MDALLYFTSFTAVLALFASTITIVVWLLVKLAQALTGRSKAKSKVQPKSATPRGKFQEDFSNPHHFKRAGQ